MDDALAILGISPGATLEEIHAAYLHCAKSAHPDAGGSQADFIRLQEAYEELLGREQTTDATSDRKSWQTTEQPSSRTASDSSFEDLMREVRERLEKEAAEAANAAKQHQQNAGVAELIEGWRWPVALTLIASTVIAVRLADSGLFPASALLIFMLCMVALPVAGGLVSMLSGSSDDEAMAAYNKFAAVVILVGGIPLGPGGNTAGDDVAGDSASPSLAEVLELPSTDPLAAGE